MPRWIEWHSSGRVADNRILAPDVEGLRAECAPDGGSREWKNPGQSAAGLERLFLSATWEGGHGMGAQA